ncbi:MAG: type I restriction enzyme HsdR N-terminal domain-containing protein [Flavobacteriales bacterium]|nr:type I restriction enzyme HsdR N-terminal domain-containing protein [Flavobacteriales bacterium]
MDLPKLNLPKPTNLKFKQENSKVYIFDEIRRKYLLLTPEEYVRQTVVHFFMEYHNHTKSAFILEKKIELNKTIKRIDILILKKDFPYLLIECKAPDIKITEETFFQSARYNTIIKAQKILLTNGITHLLFNFNKENSIYEQESFMIF